MEDGGIEDIVLMVREGGREYSVKLFTVKVSRTRGGRVGQ